MRSPISVVAVVLVVAHFFTGRLHAQDEKVALILDRCSAGLRQIKSVQCEWSDVYRAEKTEIVEAKRSAGAARQFIHGTKFRLEFFPNLATPAGDPQQISAYNGNTIFNLTKPLDSLIIERCEVSAIAPPTFNSAFNWVGEPHKLSWKALQSDATWQAIAKRARLLPTIKEGDTVFEVIEFSLPNEHYPKKVNRVYFQIDEDYFPRKNETFDGDTPLWSHEVTETGRYKLGDQSIVVPLEVVHRELRPSVRYVREFSLDENSLRLNAELDEKLFEISSDGIPNVEDRTK